MKVSEGKGDCFEIRFYERLLERSPKFFEALSALGDLYTKAGRYIDGLAVDKQLMRIRPDDPIVMYNLACSYSLLGKVDRSFVAIQRALELGYEDLEHLQKDSDLKNLHQDERFKEYFSGIWQESEKSRPQPRKSKQIFRDQ